MEVWIKTCLVLIQSRNFQENSSICLEKSAAKSKKQKKFFFSWNCSGAESVATLAAFSLAETAAVLSAKKKFVNSPMSFWQKMKEFNESIEFQADFL